MRSTRKNFNNHCYHKKLKNFSKNSWLNSACFSSWDCITSRRTSSFYVSVVSKVSIVMIYAISAILFHSNFPLQKQIPTCIIIFALRLNFFIFSSRLSLPKNYCSFRVQIVFQWGSNVAKKLSVFSMRSAVHSYQWLPTLSLTLFLFNKDVTTLKHSSWLQLNAFNIKVNWSLEN